LVPSSRGELEITDVNRAYAQRGQLQVQAVEGWWYDGGRHWADLADVGRLIEQTGANKWGSCVSRCGATTTGAGGSWSWPGGAGCRNGSVRGTSSRRARAASARATTRCAARTLCS